VAHASLEESSSRSACTCVRSEDSNRIYASQFVGRAHWKLERVLQNGASVGGRLTSEVLNSPELRFVDYLATRLGLMEPWQQSLKSSPQVASEKYRNLSETYDLRTAWAQTLRDRAIHRLEVRPGSVVLDVGCGTGLAFAALQTMVGPEGRVIGIDVSAEMLARARERTRARGWRNVTFIHSSVEEASIPQMADAALFLAAHDIMRSPSALKNVVDHVREGGRVVAAGPKWAPWWAPSVNVWVWLISRQFVATLEGFDNPWSHLREFIPNLRVEHILFGAGYITWGDKPAPSVAPASSE
jgi:SAM-dependent methyltransferase